MGFGAIGLVGGLLSTGLSVYGSLQQGKTAVAVGKYNNMLAEREADNLQKENVENINRQRINNRRNLSTLRARAASSGTISTSGTAARVLEDAAGTMEIGIADAARSANMQAESILAKGRMGMWEAKQQKKAATLSAIGQGIQGLTQAAGSAYQNYRVGSG
jgi:hypothetical protein